MIYRKSSASFNMLMISAKKNKKIQNAHTAQEKEP